MNKYLPFKKVVLLEGTTSITVYSIGWLAILLKKHPGTVRAWERKGILPEPVFEKQIDPVYRYYTAGELKGYAKIINNIYRLPGQSYPKDLKLRLHSFRQELKKQMQLRPESLVLNLAEEGQIESALKNNVDRTTKKQAAAILKAAN